MSDKNSANNRKFIGAVDQGTTSSRFLIFDNQGTIVTYHQQELPQSQPQQGWLEHDPMDIFNSVIECINKAIRRFELMGYDMKDIITIGITNQRESAVVWDNKTGEPLRPTIVWSDVRTDELVHELQKKEGSEKVKERSGLDITSYFTAVKYRWMLNNDDAVQRAVKERRASFGTVDSWLIYKLTGGKTHVTDVTNASRTLLMNLKNLQWDEELLKFFDIPEETLPEIRSCSEVYGQLQVDDCLLKDIPIAGCLGDQQAALVGQKCFRKGQAKCTFGTGAFMLFNTGEELVKSKHGLITTVGFKLGEKAKAIYALEGSMAVAGSSLRWLRDNLRLIDSMEEVSGLAAHVPDTGGVYFVTAFSGLFAPYWRDDARGTMIGLTTFTNKYHLARATLEAMSFQTYAILEAMNKDATDAKNDDGDSDDFSLHTLKVDGGVSNSDIAMQIQADILGIQVDRPSMRETTAFGAAIAAGLAAGVWNDIDDLEECIRNNSDNDTTTFQSKLSKEEREKKHKMWQKAVEASLHYKDIDEDEDEEEGENDDEDKDELHQKDGDNESHKETNSNTKLDFQELSISNRKE
ncbi:glycerol kinase [Mycotypha africana]|uniref:glycerol kinase n=1 Tax=Mycotypha africana TaxID=64632 RepID=UPI0023012C18|nr:glycerol kinase [Mycotypha africana]KAI8991632.1 glycerol kinase [Mycotypha africana]